MDTVAYTAHRRMGADVPQSAYHCKGKMSAPKAHSALPSWLKPSHYPQPYRSYL